jgi:hypothetical protein
VQDKSGDVVQGMHLCPPAHLIVIGVGCSCTSLLPRCLRSSCLLWPLGRPSVGLALPCPRCLQRGTLNLEFSIASSCSKHPAKATMAVLFLGKHTIGTTVQAVWQRYSPTPACHGSRHSPPPAAPGTPALRPRSTARNQCPPPLLLLQRYHPEQRTGGARSNRDR